MKENESIGQRLRDLRESKKLTQQELSDQLHVSDKTISKWEKDGSVPDTEMLIALSRFFEVTLDFILIGNTPIVEKESISKIELAAREDNIALLSGISLDELDDKGKNLEYYARKYKAKNISDYLMAEKINEVLEEGSKTKCNLYHITALPKHTNDEDARILVAWNGSFRKAPEECEKLEKDGYHSFKVFRELGVGERFGEDYFSLSFKYLMNGWNRIIFDMGTLDDKKSGILRIKMLKKRTFDQKKRDSTGKLVPDFYPESEYTMKAIEYIKPSIRKEFIDLLASLDFKNWKSQSWGCSIHDIFVGLANHANNMSEEKNYIDPGKENFLRFTKGIRRLCFETLNSYQYKQFIEAFSGTYIPYQREGVPLLNSQTIFRDIECEMKETQDGVYHRGDLLLK